MNGNEAQVSPIEFSSTPFPVRTRTGRGKPGDKVSLGLRPEHFIDAAGAPARLSARAQVVEQLGGVSYVYAAGEGGAQITVQQRGHSSMATDSLVEFGVDPKAALLFDAAGLRL